MYLDFLAFSYEKNAELESKNLQSIKPDNADLGDVLLGMVYQSRSDKAEGAAEVLRRLLKELPEETLDVEIDMDRCKI